jgi:hypothetical protein
MALEDFIPLAQQFQIFWRLPVRAHTSVDIDFKPNWYEVNNESITWSLTNKPAWMSINSSTGQITGSPSAEATHAGIVLTATRASGDSVSKTFTCTVSNAKYLFVNPSTGNDTTGTGAIGAPYATLAKALTQVDGTAGKTIMLRGGTYAEGGTTGPWELWSGKGRNAADYQELRGYPGEAAVIDFPDGYYGLSFAASWCVINNLKLGNGTPPGYGSCIFQTQPNTIVTDTEIYDQDDEDNLGGVLVKPDNVLADDDMLMVDRCYIHGIYSRAYDLNNAGNNNSAGIVSFTNSGNLGNEDAYIWLTNNKCEGNGHGIKNKHCGWDRLIIQNNECFGNGHTGIHAGGPKVSIRHNVCLDNLSYACFPNSDNTEAGIPMGPTWVERNTFIDRNVASAYGMMNVGSGANENGSEIRRNILHSSGDPFIMQLWAYDYDWTGQSILFDQNVYYTTDATPFVAGGSSPTGDLTFAQWQSKSAGLGDFDAQTVFVSTTFADLANGDLSIGSSTAAATMSGGYAGALQPGKTYGTFGASNFILVDFNINDSENPPVDDEEVILAAMTAFDQRLTGPMFTASSLAAVTKSDSTVLRGVRALWVGGAGDVAVVAADDTDAVTLVGVPAGTVLLVQAKKVMSTNTTATSIVALF